MNTQKFQELVVYGIQAKDTDFSLYTTTHDISQWCYEFWNVVSATFTKEELAGPINLAVALGADFERARMERYEELLMQERLKKPVMVEGVEYKAIFIFDVLWESWDCDATGWVVSTDSGNKVVFTNHGHPYFTSQTELNDCIKDHTNQIEAGTGDFSVDDYQEAIRNIQHAMSLT